MERIAIAAVAPTLDSAESKAIHAVVTLLWPYSSSTRQCALLLADPDFRLRRKQGQVRVRFSGASATAIAKSGIGIGDEVTLGLRGALFLEGVGDARTPGKSVDWELGYGRRLVIEISRDGKELAALDVDDRNPSPEPSSPTEDVPYSPPKVTPAVARVSARISPGLYSSPVFFKRNRVSDGPVFGAELNPFATDEDDNATEPRQKRRKRKSYGDWAGVYTYSARTPSPEKEEDLSAEAEESLSSEEDAGVTPSRFPRTPISPSKPQDVISVSSLPLGRPMSSEEAAHELQKIDLPNPTLDADVRNEAVLPSHANEAGEILAEEDLTNEEIVSYEEAAQNFESGQIEGSIIQDDLGDGEAVPVAPIYDQEQNNDDLYDWPEPLPSQQDIMYEHDTEPDTEDEADLAEEVKYQGSQAAEMFVEKVEEYGIDEEEDVPVGGVTYYSDTEVDSYSNVEEESEVLGHVEDDYPEDDYEEYYDEEEEQLAQPIRQPELIVLSSGEEDSSVESDEEQEHLEEVQRMERPGTQDDPKVFEENSAEEASEEATQQVVEVSRRRDRSGTQEEPIVFDSNSDEEASEDEVEQLDEEPRRRDRSGTQEELIMRNRGPEIMMPPPNIPFLRTDFTSTNNSRLQTPIGDAPTTPVLAPLTPSALPIPSPFPEERDVPLTSYFNNQQAGPFAVEEPAPKEALLESSPYQDENHVEPSDFYHLAVHNTHASNYSNIRFSFGMDGSMFSSDPAQPEESAPVLAEKEELRLDTSAPVASLDKPVEEEQFPQSDELEKDVQDDDHSIDADVDIDNSFEKVEQYPKLGEIEEDAREDVRGFGKGMEIIETFEEEQLQDVDETDGHPQDDEYDSETGMGIVVERDELEQPQLDEDDEALPKDEHDADVYMEDVDQFEEVDGEPEADENEHLRHSTTYRVDEDHTPLFETEENVTDNKTLPESESALEREQDPLAVVMNISSEEEDASGDEEDEQREEIIGQQEVFANHNDDRTQSEIHEDEEGRTVKKTPEHVHPYALRRSTREPSYPISLPSYKERVQEHVVVKEATPATTKDSDSDEELPDPEYLLSHPRQSQKGKYAEDNASQSPPIAKEPKYSKYKASLNDIQKSESFPNTPDGYSSTIPPTSQLLGTQNQEGLAPKSSGAGVPPSSRPLEIVDFGTGDSDQDEDEEMTPVPPTVDEFKKETDDSIAPRSEYDNHGKTPQPLNDEVNDSQTTDQRNTRKSLIVKVRLTKPVPEHNHEASQSSASAPAMNTRSRKQTSPVKEAAPRRNLRSRRQSTPPAKSRARTLKPAKAKESDSPLSSVPASSSFKGEGSTFESVDFPMDPSDSTPKQKSTSTKYRDGTVIKDSFDDKLHTEASISTVPFSDAEDTVLVDTYDFQDEYRNNVDEPETQLRVSETTADFPSDAETSHSRHFSEQKEGQHSLGDEVEQTQVLRQRSPSPVTQLETRRSPSPAIALSPPEQSWNHMSYDGAAESAVPDQVSYPRLPVDLLASTPPATQPESRQQDAPMQDYPLANTNLPMTPDASQNPAASQSFSSGTHIEETLQPNLSEQYTPASPPVLGTHIEETLPPTPQLTQRASAGLRSASPDQPVTSLASIARPAEIELKTRKKRGKAPAGAKSSFGSKPVPAVLSEWFVPRSSLGARPSSPSNSASSKEDGEDVETVTIEEKTANPAPPKANSKIAVKDTSKLQQRQPLELPSLGFRTRLSYYTPLSKLNSYLNMPSQALEAGPDLLAIVTQGSSPPERAKKGPKDYSTIFSITDVSRHPDIVQVQMFRPYSRALPTAQAGDVVLLHNFAVKSHKGKEILLSTEDSAWRVWRFSKPLWGVKKDQGEIEAREECSGPPAEVGDEERTEVEKIRAWWGGVSHLHVQEGKMGKGRGGRVGKSLL